MHTVSFNKIYILYFKKQGMLSYNYYFLILISNIYRELIDRINFFKIFSNI
jgi:hypothetical protein